MDIDLSWMHNRLMGGTLTPEFTNGVACFLDFAFGNPQFINVDRIRCLCKLCDNLKFLTREVVEIHLCKKGFTDYNKWYLHREPNPDNLENNDEHVAVNVDSVIEMRHQNLMMDMVLDAAGSTFNWDATKEQPNAEAQKFSDLLKVAEEPLWEVEARFSYRIPPKELHDFVVFLLHIELIYYSQMKCIIIV